MVFNATFNNISVISDTLPFGHAPIPNIIDLSQKKQLLDLKVKGQGSTKVVMDMQHTTLWIWFFK
jgi:hypothetical protein